MDKFKTVEKAFAFLRRDCSNVALFDFVDKDCIPEKATKEDFESEDFTHSFSDVLTSGFDDCDFFGSIYLPLCDDVYMQFWVNA